MGVKFNPFTGELDLVGTGGGSNIYSGSSPTNTTVGGLSSGTSISGQTVQDILQSMLVVYQGPLVSLSVSPSSSLREKGNTVSSVTLTATTTKRSNNITSLTLKRNGSLIYTFPSPNPAGAAEVYTDTTPFSDTTTFQATVGDGTTTANSSLITYSYVYPYFYGVGAPGLSVAQIQALTKDIISNTNSKAVTLSPTSQVFYFAYPLAYGALTSILDKNSFESISDWTRTTRTFVGLDTTSQSYYVYEFNNVTTQVNFTNTFKK